MKRLSEEEQLRSLHEELKLPWAISDGCLTIQLSFKSLQEVHELLTRLAREANEQHHHPDIVVNAKEVTISLTTYDAAGLTLLDVAFAQAVEKHVERIRSLRTI